MRKDDTLERCDYVCETEKELEINHMLKDGVVERCNNITEEKKEEDLTTALDDEDLEDKKHTKIQKLNDGMLERCNDTKGPLNKQIDEKMLHGELKEGSVLQSCDDIGMLRVHDGLGAKLMYDDRLGKKRKRCEKRRKSKNDDLLETCDAAVVKAHEKESLKVERTECNDDRLETCDAAVVKTHEKESLKVERTECNGSEKETIHAVYRVDKTYDVLEKCDDVKLRDKEETQVVQTKDGGQEDKQTKEICTRHKELMEDGELDRCNAIVVPYKQDVLRAKPVDDDGLAMKTNRLSKHRKCEKADMLPSCDYVLKTHKKEYETTEDNGSEKETVHTVYRMPRAYDALERYDDIVGKDKEGSQQDEATKEKMYEKHKELMGHGALESSDDIVKSHEKKGLKAKRMGDDGLEKKMKRSSKRRKTKKDDMFERSDEIARSHEEMDQKDNIADENESETEELHAVNTATKKHGALKRGDDVEPKHNGASGKIDLDWPGSLSDSQLDVLVSIKKLAAEHSLNAGSKWENLLSPSALRAIGILLDELAKDRVRSLLCAHKSTGRASEGPSQQTMQ